MLDYIFAILLALGHFFNDYFDRLVHRYREKVISLGAGVSVAYIFLLLFPELSLYSQYNNTAFIFVLVGFVIFHVAEKHVYSHTSKTKMLYELKEIHSVAFFIYHFLIGIVLYYFVQGDWYAGLLFFIPILFYSLVSSVSFSEIHKHIKEKWALRVVLSVPPVLGVLFVHYYSIPNALFVLILGFVVGALLYVVVRDSIPKLRQGDVRYFVAGALAMLILVVLTGQL